ISCRSFSIQRRFAYKTILLHKSAISTFCAGNPVNENLSSNFLVRQILKSISIANPKEIKSPIWDSQLLINWLSKGTSNLSPFELSRRSATLLLLASGRRIHDLTLLKISPNYLINLGNEIILWPVFGSKTDRSSFRQSGWRLSHHPNKWLCPITMIRAMLKKSEDRRKSKESLDDLFISLSGPVKSATKTMIAGWVRSVLKEAGIDT
ncbi:uncharacterized protein LOC122503581, partial [Leptopilina heterotoma]|uniref:uncharacterized protein LOC122503581 n=1 Tax=Leptopilina heterotoma TaxID=63436 RepID=UPI001CA9B819